MRLPTLWESMERLLRICVLASLSPLTSPSLKVIARERCEAARRQRKRTDVLTVNPETVLRRTVCCAMSTTQR
jgi:hypothetical protein